jgi:PPOX class probable F420-dependent enzyme
MTGPPANYASLLRARRGYLGTHGKEETAEVMPVCFTWAGEAIWIALDVRRPAALALLKIPRGGDLGPPVCFIVDRWDEDWSKLGWLQARGTATVLERGQESERAMEALASKYTQYRKRAIKPSIIRLDVEEWRGIEPEEAS